MRKILFPIDRRRTGLMVRRALPGLCIAAAIVSGLAAARSSAADQGAQLLPRVAAAKPARSTIGARQDPHLVVLKFAEGTDIRLREGIFVSPSVTFSTGGVNKAISDA